MKTNTIRNLCICGALTLAAVLLIVPPQAGATSGTLVITTDTTLTEDHQGNILINASKVTLDCAGHTVSGPGASGFNGGIEVTGLSGITVRRCNVTAFDVNGIYVGGGATDGRFESNVVYENGNHGMHLDVGSGYVVLGNTCHDNGAIGIVLTGATNSWIVQNTTEGQHNWAGISLLGGSDNNWVLENTANQNGAAIVLDGASNNHVRYNSMSSNDNQRVLLIRSADHNIIEFNVAKQNAIGFQLTDGAASNQIRNNQSNGNSSSGFEVYQSNSNMFVSNTAAKNGNYGFLVYGGSSYNTLIGNSAFGSGQFDGYDEQTGTGNVWKNNHFIKTTGF
ncbi:MAG TPA: right-handed parallel beta-helix repeat-containing protein [Candidatus Solibacter sp.]|nr:right-handed parallel beta-helix repeat-containing protein [Candidatus Solibacter sp.]